MIVTEQEAWTKLCPEAIGPGDDRWVMTPWARKCIGSGCMAWRWHAWTEYLKGDIGENDFVETALVSATHGYCGKAGRQLAVGKLGEGK